MIRNSKATPHEEITADATAAAKPVTYPAKYQTEIASLIDASIADNTKTAYQSRIRAYLRCAENIGIKDTDAYPASPEIVAAYLAYLSGQNAAYSTVAQTCAALKVMHESQGHPTPTNAPVVKQLLKGYRRKHGIAPHKKAAATIDIIREMIDALTESYRRGEHDIIRLARDTAIIMTGFCGAFRRSELRDLDLDDLTWITKDQRDVILINVRKSKTDQEGVGMTKVLYAADDKRYCPVTLLRRWIRLSGITTGPLFRPIRRGGHVQTTRLTTQNLARIIKGAALLAHIDLDISGHSLRSGFVTTAIRQGKTERSIMNQTGHRSVQVLRGYYQRENVIDDNAADGLVDYH